MADQDGDSSDSAFQVPTPELRKDEQRSRTVRRARKPISQLKLSRERHSGTERFAKHFKRLKSALDRSWASEQSAQTRGIGAIWGSLLLMLQVYTNLPQLKINCSYYLSFRCLQDTNKCWINSRRLQAPGL